MQQPVTIAMVYRTNPGKPEYRADDVARLVRGLRRNLSEHQQVELVCFTDAQNEVDRLMLPVQSVPLVKGWPGWWSKIELFRRIGPVLYFDLDTVIVGRIDPLLDALRELPPFEFLMLNGFYRPDLCSGIMGWTGDFAWLQEAFAKDGGRSAYRGDQEWIRAALSNRGVHVRRWQSAVPGLICSYKVDVLGEKKTARVRPPYSDRGVPKGASVVCFHGKPRPRDVSPQPAWMVENWR